MHYQTLEVQIGADGRVWVNIDGRCALRALPVFTSGGGPASVVLIDDRGRPTKRAADCPTVKLERGREAAPEYL